MVADLRSGVDMYSVSLGAAVELACDQMKLLARAIKRLQSSVPTGEKPPGKVTVR
jgi:hypothetical protein